MACEPSVAEPGAPSQLALAVVPSVPAAATAATATITLEGPTPRKRTAPVGTTVTLEELAPGLYTVSVEGMDANNDVVWYNETVVTVTAGSTTRATISAVPFQASALSITGPASVQSGQVLRLSWGATPGAANYVVEWGRVAGGQRNSRTTTQTTIDLDVSTVGVDTVNVRPVTRFSNRGTPYTPLVVTVTPPAYTLTIVGTGNGSGRVTSSSVDNPGAINCTISLGTATGACSANFAPGTIVTLTAVPTGPMAWTGWGGACSGSSALCQITMSQSRSVNAGFTANTSLLIVRGSGNGSGRVAQTSSQPPYTYGINCVITNGSANCDVAYPNGTIVALTATAEAGSIFAGYSGNSCSGLSPTCDIVMNEARTVTATFTRPDEVADRGPSVAGPPTPPRRRSK
jgi:hypothetical protein